MSEPLIIVITMIAVMPPSSAGLSVYYNSNMYNYKT